MIRLPWRWPEQDGLAGLLAQLLQNRGQPLDDGIMHRNRAADFEQALRRVIAPPPVEHVHVAALLQRAQQPVTRADSEPIMRATSLSDRGFFASAKASKMSSVRSAVFIVPPCTSKVIGRL
jgi:hypothetical protein